MRVNVNKKLKSTNRTVKIKNTGHPTDRLIETPFLLKLLYCPYSDFFGDNAPVRVVIVGRYNM